MKTKGIVLAGVAILAAMPGRATGHQTLYHNIEINLHDPKKLRIFVTVHAPELPSGVAAGIDPSAVDEDWLRSRSDAELEQLLGEAGRFIRETFAFSVVPHGDAPVEPISPNALPIDFEMLARIRDPEYDNGLPAGCFLATVSLENPGAPRGFAIAFSPAAEKRLLLAVARPGEFPEVHDLAAAESVQIELPEVPSSGFIPVGKSSDFAFLTVIAAVAVIALLAFRKRAVR